MIAAADSAPVDRALMQRNLSVRATIGQRKYIAFARSDDDDRIAGKPCGKDLTSLHLMRPGQRIPMIRMRIDGSQIAFARIAVSHRRNVTAAH
jgi:hypothetical protein